MHTIQQSRCSSCGGETIIENMQRRCLYCGNQYPLYSMQTEMTSVQRKQEVISNYVTHSTQANGGVKRLLEEGKLALKAEEFIKAAEIFDKAIYFDKNNGTAWLGAFLADLQLSALENGHKLASIVIKRMCYTANSIDACQKGMQNNMQLLQKLNGQKYRQALNFSSGHTMDALISGKKSIIDYANICNQNLQRALQAYKQERQEDEYGKDNRCKKEGNSGRLGMSITKK